MITHNEAFVELARPELEHELRTSIEWQGRVMSVGSTEAPKDKPNSKRGKCKDFSERAARRCVESTNKIDWPWYLERDMVRLLTLTYPACLFPALVVAKGHLRAFFEYLRRHYPTVSIIHVLERQESGVPHFHLIWAGHSVQAQDIVRIREAWERVIGWNYLAEGHHVQVNFQYATDVAGICKYLTSYVIKAAKAASSGSGSSKLDSGPYPHGPVELDEETGVQWWGYHQRFRFKMAELHRVEGKKDTKALARMRRAVRNWLKARARAGEKVSKRWFRSFFSEAVKGFTFYTDNPWRWAACFATCCEEIT